MTCVNFKGLDALSTPLIAQDKQILSTIFDDFLYLPQPSSRPKPPGHNARALAAPQYNVKYLGMDERLTLRKEHNRTAYPGTNYENDEKVSRVTEEHNPLTRHRQNCFGSGRFRAVAGNCRAIHPDCVRGRVPRSRSMHLRERPAGFADATDAED
jgi:hypothetical protein